MLLLQQPMQSRSTQGLQLFFYLPSNAILAPALETVNHGAMHWRGEKGKMCSQQRPVQTPSLENSNFSSFTYFPNNLLIPLAFFLESGEGGVICRLSASFAQGGKPVRSKLSADPFSVSAVRKQQPHEDPLKKHCADTLLNSGTALATVVESHHVKEIGHRGMGKSRRINMYSSFMGLTGNTPRQGSAPVKCLASKMGNNHLVN